MNTKQPQDPKKIQQNSPHQTNPTNIPIEKFQMAF
jgi:hypothetical protein